MGKTTLAHVAAAHCGYEVVEINASVDRSMKALEHLFTTALSNTKVVSTAKPNRKSANSKAQSSSEKLLRPKCLIIDEMDGIAANVVPLLLHKIDKHRPVICLANDLYAPALRELRQNVNFILQVPPIAPTRLLSRLEVVVAKENCPVSKASLSELCHMCNGDVRSCLNNLQLVCAQSSLGAKTGSAAAAKIQNILSNMKLKDGNMNIWTLWKEILSKRERSAYHKLLDMDTAAQMLDRRGGGSRMDLGYLYALKLLESASEMDILLDGIFQYFPQHRYADYTMGKTVSCSDSFAFYDIATKSSYEYQSFGFSNALGKYTAAQCHARCATLTKMKQVQYPRDAMQAKQKAKSNLAALKAFTEATPAVAVFTTTTNAAQDVVGLLPPCLLPQIKIPVTFSLMSLNAQEKAGFQECVERHALYGLTYRRRIKTGGYQAAASGGGQAQTQQSAQSNAASAASGGKPGFGAGAGQGAQEQQDYWSMEPDLESVATIKRKATADGAFIRGFKKESRGKFTGDGIITAEDGKTKKFYIRSDIKEVIASEVEKWLIAKRAQSAFKDSVAAAANRKALFSDPRQIAASAPLHHTTGSPIKEPAAHKAADAPPTAPKVVMKKDFFGRPIVAKPKEATNRKRTRGEVDCETIDVDGEDAATTTTTKPSAKLHFSAPLHTVKYNHFDGSTNEIRRDATLHDLL